MFSSPSAYASACSQSLLRLVFTPFVFFAFFAFGIDSAVAQTSANPPKREFRGVWIASVSNIDFPLSRTDTPEKQRADFISILDAHRAMGINAVFVQVRPAADALYAKSREPWSFWLTGKQGQAPTPLWDPLEFMIAEAHKRNMEFHAWFNPFRSVSASTSDVADSHISKTRPDWHLTFANPFKLLDPGNPDVRGYVASVVMDVVRGYDIDGVHFDDYFYPYGGTTTQDTATFRLFSRGIPNIANWRRDNVNIFVKMMNDSINAVKPFVKFGISPFGIWKSGTPAGIVGLNAFDVIYCDAVAWLQAKSIDYILPQLYWKFGGGQDYAKLMPWWLGQASQAERHLYTGLAAYRLSPTEPGGDWSASDIVPQIEANQAQSAHGSVFFSSKQLTTNLKGLNAALTNGLFKTIALPPTMPWKDAVAPLAPTSLAAQTNSSANSGTNSGSGSSAAGVRRVSLSWTKPARASDGDTATRYAVYRFAQDEAINVENARACIGITTNTNFIDSTSDATALRLTYVVTALDRLWNESTPSARVMVTTTSVAFARAVVALSEPAPNPASGAVTLRFYLSKSSAVSITLHNALGGEVLRLPVRILPAGEHSELLEVRGLPAGVYLCRFVSDESVATRRVVVLE